MSSNIASYLAVDSWESRLRGTGWTGVPSEPTCKERTQDPAPLGRAVLGTARTRTRRPARTCSEPAALRPAFPESHPAAGLHGEWSFPGTVGGCRVTRWRRGVGGELEDAEVCLSERQRCGVAGLC